MFDWDIWGPQTRMTVSLPESFSLLDLDKLSIIQLFFADIK